MRFGWLAIALVAALAAAPVGVAKETATTTSTTTTTWQEAFGLVADTYRAIPLEALAGDAYSINVTADVPVDAILLQGHVDTFYAAGGSYRILVVGLNGTDLRGAGTLETEGPWTLVLDNTNRTLADGAPGTHFANVTVQARLDRTTTVVTPVDLGSGGSRNPWPVLMLTAPFWDLAILGLGGMACWFLILAALAAPKYQEGWAKVGVLALGVGLLVGAWLLLPRPGPISQIGFPLLVAAGVAWLSLKGATDVRQQVRLAFLGAGLGALLATLLAYVVALLWADNGLLVLGGDRFADPVFLLPVAALFGVLLVALVTAFVHAFDEEDVTPTPEKAGLGAAFTVVCIRCGTSINVNRSLRRYRIATDRYEFACPNCQTRMEWAEPKPPAA